MKLKKINDYKSENKNIKSMLEYKNDDIEQVEMDETDYLLSTEANRKKLLEGVRQAEAGETILVNKKKNKYELYEIELNSKTNILHTDQDSIDLSGYFLYDFISKKKNIKILLKNL